MRVSEFKFECEKLEHIGLESWGKAEWDDEWEAKTRAGYCWFYYERASALGSKLWNKALEPSAVRNHMLNNGKMCRMRTSALGLTNHCLYK
jgi:hypothetical protein